MLLAAIRALIGRITRHVTFDDALAHYERVIAQRDYQPRTLQNLKSVLLHLRPVFAGRVLRQIRPFEISGVVNNLTSQGKLNTSKQALLLMRDICNEAVLMGWLDSNPALHVKSPKLHIRRQRMTLEQWRLIRSAGAEFLPAWFPAMMTLALVTGQRRSDLALMRWDHVRDDHLYIEQFKTGAMIALPLDLRLDAINTTLREAVDACAQCVPCGKRRSDYLLCRSNGNQLGAQSLSNRFWAARERAGIDVDSDNATPPSLHEVRSLAERLYRAQGVDTQTLLGHKNASQTNVYHDDRGLSRGTWKVLELRKSPDGTTSAPPRA